MEIFFLVVSPLSRVYSVKSEDSVPFSLSKQPLTAFAILSYGKRDFATDFRSKAIETEKTKET